MIQVAPTSKRPPLLAFGAVALIALLMGMAIRSGPLTSVVAETEVPTTGASPATTESAASTWSATPSASPKPPAPTPDLCLLPSRLPVPTTPVVAPTVSGGDLALVFASHLYAGSSGNLAVRNALDDQWAVGLWFVDPGTSEARMLSAPANGMVLPLALSPTGDRAAIWWMPQRRGMSEPACEGGIYDVFTGTGRAEFVTSSDWTIDPADEDKFDAADWRDPETGSSDPRRYDLPEAAFSSDGRYLALVDGSEITIYAPGQANPAARHLGACTEWAWSPVGPTFVAGCEAMTTAWVADLEGGLEQANVALPQPPFGVQHPGWEVREGQAIGITREGQLRVTRFYGFATGCEEPGCVIPRPAYAVTTINPATGAASHQTTQINFVVGDATRDPVRLNADASWIYAAFADDRGAAVLRIGTGALPTPKPLPALLFGTMAGPSRDGSLLYGWRAEQKVVVAAINSAGVTRDVATIDWPVGANSASPVIATFGLAIAAPPS